MKRFLLVINLLFIVISSPSQSADSLKSIIYYHYDRNEFVEVVDYAHKAIDVFEEENNLFDMAGCYNILGVAYQRLGQLAEAIDSYNRCCELMEEIGKSEPDNPYYQRNIRYTKNNMAEIFSSMGEYDQAVAMYQSCIESLGTPRDTTEYQDMATYLSNLASVIINVSESGNDAEGLKIEDAVSMAEQALDYSKQYGDYPYKLYYRMMTLAKAYLAVGRNDEAIAIVNEGLALTDNDDDLYQRTGFLLLLGDYQLKNEEYRAAEETYAQVVAIARKGHYGEHENQALQGAYQASKQFDKALALDYFEDYVALKDSIFNDQQQMLLREYQARYELMEKEHQLEIQEEKTKQNRYLAMKNRYLAMVFFAVAVLLVTTLVFGFFMYWNKKRQNTMLSHYNEIKNNLLSVASHDVKTSIIAQNMVLDQMYQHCTSMTETELKDCLLALKTSSDGMKEKLTNIMQWIMGEFGGGLKESRPSKFNLSELADSSIASHSTIIKAKDISVVNDIDPYLECNDDTTIVGSVLQNLISNAVKFSNRQGEVFVTAEEEGDKVWVSVTDHGVGIDAEKLKVLMDEIVKPTQGTAGETGTGLGLLVCRRLLAQSGGEIKVESTPGVTTIVRFSVKK